MCRAVPAVRASHPAAEGPQASLAACPERVSCQWRFRVPTRLSVLRPCVRHLTPPIPQVDEHNKVARINGHEIRQGDFISLNGSTGEIIRGKQPLKPPELAGDLGK